MRFVITLFIMKKSVPKRRRHFIEDTIQNPRRKTDASPRLTTRQSCVCVAAHCAPPDLPGDSHRRCRSYRDGPLGGSVGDKGIGRYESRSVQHNLSIDERHFKTLLPRFRFGHVVHTPHNFPMSRLTRIHLRFHGIPACLVQFPILRVKSVQHLYSPQLFCTCRLSFIREFYILS